MMPGCLPAVAAAALNLALGFRLPLAGLLAALPVQVAGPYPSVQANVAALARFTRQFEPDRTHHHWGRWLHSMGWRRSLGKAEVAQQASRIIPVAAGHLAAMYAQFLEATH